MNPARARLLAVAGLTAALVGGASAIDPARAADSAGSDWPQYRGVHRDGVAPGAGLASAWPEGGPRVVWKTALGSAFSQLVVHGDGLFTGASSEDREFLVRLDRETGKEVWRAPVGELFADSFGAGPRSTPTVDGTRVFFLGAKGTLVAVDAGDGSMLWSADLVARFGAEVPRFGFSGSPLVVGDLLLIEVGGKDEASLVAFDKTNGERKWAALSGPAGYGSAIVTEILGSRHVVLNRGKTVTGVDLGGNVLWTHDLAESAIAMPVAV
jgi:outer membrane protein assembly factor BamB